MRSTKLSIRILSSLAPFVLLLGCRGGPDTSNPGPEGPENLPPLPRAFDSDILKISLFRIAPVVEGGEGKETGKGDKKIRGRFHGEPQYSVLLSHGWLLKRGPRVNEKYLKGAGRMVVSYNAEGTPNEDMRRFVRLLTRAGVMNLPAAEAAPPTEKEMEKILEAAKDPRRSREWEWARILVIESGEERRTIFPLRFQNRPDLLQKYRKVEKLLAKILVLRAPTIGRFRVVDDLQEH